MKIRVNMTGTSIKRGLLRVRLDLFPDENCKTYPLYHVQKPDDEVPGSMYVPVDDAYVMREPDYTEWLAATPQHWELNPLLCIFVSIKETTTQAELVNYIETILKPDDLITLDDILVRSDSAHYVSPFMRNKPKFEKDTIASHDLEDLIASTNERLGSLDIQSQASGIRKVIQPQSIDVGDEAIARPYNYAVTYTRFSLHNPANAPGTLDTAEVYCSSNIANFEVGSIYLVSGTTYRIRDNHVIGAVSGGSKHTDTSLEVDIESGDYFACYGTSGNIYIDVSSPGYLYVAGEFIDEGDQVSYSQSGSYGLISLKGTGSESGGGLEIPVAMHHRKMMGVS